MTETIAILGATGKLGRELVAAALSRGLVVRALARHSFAPRVASETVVVGDATDASVVRELVRGTSAVVSLVGPGAASPVDVSTRFTRVLLDAMKAERVARLVYVTGAMVGHPHEHRGTVYRLIPRLMPATAKAQTVDRAQAEREVMSSPLDWTVVRPPRLADGPPRGGVVHGESIRIGSLAAIRRSDLATFLVDVVRDASFVHRAVAVRGR